MSDMEIRYTLQSVMSLSFEYFEYFDCLLNILNDIIHCRLCSQCLCS